MSTNMTSKLCDLLHGMKPVIVMVVVQAVLAGVNIFYKLAVEDGMSMRILVSYRFIFATAFVAPLALVLERGALGQNLYIQSLSLTSTTFVAAMANLIPVLTFILATSLGVEKLAIKTMAGNAKVVGTVLSIAGAMVLSFYKGREINIWSTDIKLIKHNENHPELSHSHQVLGSLLALASCLSFAVWYIIQAKIGKRYPCQYSSTALMCGTASIQATVYAMCVERDLSAWKLGWNIRLLGAAYTGALATGLVVAAITWCVRKRGPIFVSIFNPLALVFVALVGSLFLDEKVYLGSFVGSVLVIIGLYTASWGKTKEMKKDETNLAQNGNIIETETTHNQISSV
ncbi:WAT1-related protein At1g68170-like isoform X2 [Tripterygium wilfordii]|uniref:WAT1-related protein At1g68170-like isoform X2 n=1 Tax=Tripterygium wilfordii TaxID=458696 RepID=UPI0018F81E20|nr:WAT1-related protein At1g68170-like isoform X2 [Tripterygium wilfordii]